MGVVVETEQDFTAGNPSVVFEGPYLGFGDPGLGPLYDVSPDGEQFLMIKEATETTSAEAQIIVVENWFEELTRLVPTK